MHTIENIPPTTTMAPPQKKGCLSMPPKLQASHHYLNSFIHRIDQDTDPSCRIGCETYENPQYILETCPKNEPFCRKIQQFFADKKPHLNYETLLGFINTAIDTRTQFKIRNLTAKILLQSALTDIV
jgi:hypothetical protein